METVVEKKKRTRKPKNQPVALTEEIVVQTPVAPRPKSGESKKRVVRKTKGDGIVLSLAPALASAIVPLILPQIIDSVKHFVGQSEGSGAYFPSNIPMAGKGNGQLLEALNAL